MCKPVAESAPSLVERDDDDLDDHCHLVEHCRWSTSACSRTKSARSQRRRTPNHLRAVAGRISSFAARELHVVDKGNDSWFDFNVVCLPMYVVRVGDDSFGQNHKKYSRRVLLL